MEKIKQKLQLAALYSHRAYGTPMAENEVLLSDPVTDAQVLVAKTPVETDKYDVIVAFRGTESLQDSRYDLHIAKDTPACFRDIKPRVLVHKGFASQYESLRDKVMASTQGCTRILTTGHSLGSANAALFACDIAIHRPDVVIECITFGSPRVGGRNFVKLFNKIVDSSIRCVNNLDCVSWLPTALRFRHVRGCIRVSSGRGPFGITNPVLDHWMEKYFQAIERIPDGKAATDKQSRA